VGRHLGRAFVGGCGLVAGARAEGVEFKVVNIFILFSLLKEGLLDQYISVSFRRLVPNITYWID
jgi:hypothetical protein